MKEGGRSLISHYWFDFKMNRGVNMEALVLSVMRLVL